LTLAYPVGHAESFANHRSNQKIRAIARNEEGSVRTIASDIVSNLRVAN